MKASLLSIPLVLAISAFGAAAQQAPAAAPAPKAAASAPADCVRGKAMHGTDKGAMPMPMYGPCAGEAASAPKPLHDHNKSHKQG